MITEGREGGTAGIFRPSGEMRTGLVDEIVATIDPAALVFEAPTKASQAWFVKRLRARRSTSATSRPTR